MNLVPFSTQARTPNTYVFVCIHTALMAKVRDNSDQLYPWLIRIAQYRRLDTIQSRHSMTMRLWSKIHEANLV